MTETKLNCNCEQHAPEGFLTSGFRQDGEQWICPNCGKKWTHDCDEASGCCWFETGQVWWRPAVEAKPK